MTPDIAIDLMLQAIWLVITIVALLVVPGLIMGLLVSLFQAATQINEQTLSFLPRLIVTLLALAFSARWLVTQLMDFACAFSSTPARCCPERPLHGTGAVPFAVVLAADAVVAVCAHHGTAGIRADFGDATVPMRVRVILAMVLAIVVMPAAPVPYDIDPLSLTAVAVTLEQVAIGAMLGLGLQFATTSLSILACSRPRRPAWPWPCSMTPSTATRRMP